MSVAKKMVVTCRSFYDGDGLQMPCGFDGINYTPRKREYNCEIKKGSVHHRWIKEVDERQIVLRIFLFHQLTLVVAISKELQVPEQSLETTGETTRLSCQSFHIMA